MRCPHEVIVSCDSSAERYSAAVWDPSSGSLVQHYKHADAIGHHSMQLLKDSYIIGSSATKPVLNVWPLNCQTPVSNLRMTTPGKVTALSCTPNGSFITAAIGEKIYLWQSCNGQMLNHFARHYQTVTCLVLNKDGSLLASGGEDGLIFVWSLAQLATQQPAQHLSTFSQHSLAVKDLVWGHIGLMSYLYSVSLDRTARVYNVFSSKVVLTFIFDYPLTTLCLDIMENEFFVGTSTGMVMKCYLRDPPRASESHISETSEKVLAYKGHTGSISALQVSVDGITLLSGSIDGNIFLWDIKSCQILLTIKHKGPIVSAFFATAYDNFKSKQLRPSVCLQPLQKVSNISGQKVLVEDKNSFIEVCSPTAGVVPVVNIDGLDSEFPNENDTPIDYKQKFEEAQMEIERLKKANSDLYKYNLRNIMESKELDLDEKEMS